MGFHECKPWIDAQGECAFAQEHEDEDDDESQISLPSFDEEAPPIAQRQHQEKPYETATVLDVEAYLRGERSRGAAPKPIGVPERRPALEPVGVPKTPSEKVFEGGTLLHPLSKFSGELAVELITLAAVALITKGGASFTSSTLKGAEQLAAQYAGSGGRAILGSGAGVASWMASLVGGRKKKKLLDPVRSGFPGVPEFPSFQDLTPDFAAEYLNDAGEFYNLNILRDFRPDGTPSTQDGRTPDQWTPWIEGLDASEWSDAIDAAVRETWGEDATWEISRPPV